MLGTELACAFAFGSVGYGALELLWRGWTHWTMPPLGGVCFCAMHLISTRTHLNRAAMCLSSCAFITTAELLTGCVVNRALGWNVWDYSGRPGNVLGQICPEYSLMWLALSVPGTAICRRAKRELFH